MNERRKLLEEAANIIDGDRDNQYGGPEKSFELIADFWNVYLKSRLEQGLDLEGYDVAAMMILFKLARLLSNNTHRDSILDIAGYAGCYAEIVSAKKNSFYEE